MFFNYFKKLIYRILQNPFIRNVTTLSSGTVISQAVVVLASSVLARIYSVDDFGVLSIFTSFSYFLAVFATGRYEFAIVIPEQREKAIQLIRLILTIGLLTSLLYLLLIFLLKEVFMLPDKTGFLYNGSAYWAPCYIFLIASNTAFGYWILRQKKYKFYSLITAVQIIATTIVSLLLGWMHIPSGMIIALVVGALVFNILFWFRERDLFAEIKQTKSIWDVAKEYVNFPKYKLASDLALTASQQFVPILLSVLYSTTVVGFFSMANRMLRLPNIVITTSIGSVFRNDAIEAIRVEGNCSALYRSTLKKLLWMSFPIYLLIFLIAPLLFSWYFGAEWVTAGHYAQIIATFLLFEFIATPFNELFVLRERQQLLMRIQLSNTLLGTLMLVAGWYFFNSTEWSLVLFSINAILFNLIFLWNSYKLSNC